MSNKPLIIDFERIPPPPPAPSEEDEIQRAENDVEQIEKELDKEALDLKEQANRIKRDDDVYEFRKEGYNNLFLLIKEWLALVGVFLFGAALSAFKLSDSVLIALLSTSTATVLGIFAIAAKWLFPKK